jgi:hypothetical protein
MPAGASVTSHATDLETGTASHASAVSRHLFYKHLVAAMSLGFVLRLFFIIHFPFRAGDTKFYVELARNWLDHGVYGLFVNGRLTPVDMRMPGYPAFLAALYAAFRQSPRIVMVVQAFIDLVTCVLSAMIAARIAPARSRTPVAIIALWMAALCPFTANYTATVLTEVLATFLMTLAVLAFVIALDRVFSNSPSQSPDRNLFSQAEWWLLTGFIAGLGALVRPETPLLLLSAGLVLVAYWRHPADWSRLLLAVAWMSVGLILPLTPWAARNAKTLGRVEFLAPRYAETYGDFIPRGFYAWTATWMFRFGEAYLVTWKLGKEPIQLEDLPASAFDSSAERTRVETLFARYNHDLHMTPILDHEFGLLARERSARHPIRTYIMIPLARMWTIWFTPRIALLPYSGKLWPPAEAWRNSRKDFVVTLGFGILNSVYLGMALVGAWGFRRQPAVAFLIALVAVRTIFLTRLQTVEPRYVIVCYPVILVLAALAWSPAFVNHSPSAPIAPESPQAAKVQSPCDTIT